MSLVTFLLSSNGRADRANVNFTSKIGVCGFDKGATCGVKNVFERLSDGPSLLSLRVGDIIVHPADFTMREIFPKETSMAIHAAPKIEIDSVPC